MKNTMNIWVIVSGIALLAVSCAKENSDVMENTPTSPKMITVSCSIANSASDTKVTLTNDGEKGKTAWEATDEVLFHGKKMGTDGTKVYSCVVTPSSISADGKTAYFTIPAIDEKYDGVSDNYRSSMFAIYPASAVNSYSNGDSWKYVQAFKETNHFLLAGYNDTEVNEGNTFTFVPMSGALSFKVSGDFDKYVFSGNNNEAVSYDKYSVTAAMLYKEGTPEIRPYYTGGSGAGGSSGPQTSITVEPEGSAWCNGSTINTIYLPNGANFTKGFTIKFYKEGSEVKRVSTSTAKNIARGKYLDLGVITDHLYTYVPPTTHDSSIGLPADDSRFNLSKTASANCYIVDASNDENKDAVFKFRAYQGNSSTGVGTINSVSLLWETYNNAETVTANSVIAAVDYDKQAGKDYYEITFKMPSTLHAGNALIAAKDSEGTILWSWHIWVPETVIAQNTYGISTPEMMDRNLGALRIATAGEKDIQAVGMLYQWGRKDPFPNKKVYSSSSNDYTSHATLSSISTDFTVEKNLITFSYSVQHPTVFAAIDSGNTDWTSDENDKYWDATKTMYDPCPPGYRVPAVSETSLLTEGITSCTGWAYNTGNCSFSAGLSDNFTVFPTGMLYQNGRFDEPLNKALIWSSVYESSHRAVGLYVKVEGAEVSTYKRSRANGGSVRCVAE